MKKKLKPLKNNPLSSFVNKGQFLWSASIALDNNNDMLILLPHGAVGLTKCIGLLFQL